MSDDEESDKGLEVEDSGAEENEPKGDAQKNKLIDELFGQDDEDDDSSKPAPVEQDEGAKALSMREKLLAMLSAMPDQKGKPEKAKKRKPEAEDKPKRKRKKGGEEGGEEGAGEKKPKKPRKKKEGGEAGADAKPKKPRRKKEGAAGPAAASSSADGVPAEGSGVQFDEEETSAPKNELDEALERLKMGRRAKKSSIPAEQIKEQVVGFVNRMEKAADDDMEANRQRKPAINKLKMAPEVIAQLEKRPLRPYFMDCQILQVLARWMQRLPDGSIPNPNVRSAVLKSLKALSLGSDDMDLLGNTDLGKSVTYFGTQYQQETSENQRLARELKDLWARYTFQKTTDFSQLREHEMERAEIEGLPSRRVEPDLQVEESGKRKSEVAHARIPNKMEFNFLRRPESKVETTQMQAQPAESKEGAKYRIKKKIQEKKTGGIFRPLKMSVEGRNMHVYKT